METKIIVGLGNPSKKYEKTRHNIGNVGVDVLIGIFADESTPSSTKLQSKFDSFYFERELGGKKVILIMPQTYMNQSGKSVSQWVKYYQLKPEDILVIHDEIDLPFGQLRLSSGGSAGHKGIESIITAIGSGLSRLRIGIENRPEYRVPPTEDYVLQKFTSEEQKKLEEEIIPKVIEEIKKWLNLEIEN